MRSVRVVIVGVVLAAVVAAVGAGPVLAQWPTTCIELNDMVEAHLGNHGNVGIYQRVFGAQAEAACQNDHRDDVRGVFAWAFADAAPSADTATPDLAWPTDCVELNDIVEAHLGNENNVEIYQRVFGERAEAACRNDHRADVQGVFTWAFDGDRLAFVSLRHGYSGILVMHANGSGESQLTDTAASDINPAWAPDGRRLAFSSNRDGNSGNFEIYVMRADGSGLTRLTHDSAVDADPAWTPDGRRLAFTSDRDGDFEIYVMQVDGSGLTQLTHNATRDIEPAWAPDGRRLAFTSNRDGDREIFVMNADGSGPTQLTNNATRDQSPAWAPDGRRLAFASNRDGDWEIYVMHADGSGLTQVTHNSVGDDSPVWWPTPG